MRRAAVACSPSWRTEMTRSVAIKLAKAPYACGPRKRAASMVKAYVATFMTAMATPMPAPLRMRPRKPPDPEVTPESLGSGDPEAGIGLCCDVGKSRSDTAAVLDSRR
jgi:hypothetical protein